MDLEGAVVVVTGASRGIGEATAFALAQRGAALGLIARSEADLGRVAGKLGRSARSARSAVAVADVADQRQVHNAIQQVVDELGDVDVLVNNAGVGSYASMLDEDVATFERLMRVNYLGTVYPTLAVLPSMAARRRGHIVNVASIAGRVGAPFEAAYSASKFAVVGMSEALAAEVQGFGIRVSLVNPGPVRTHFTEARGVPFQRKIPRPVSAERIAEAVVAAIESDRFEQIIPRWLKSGPIVRALRPEMYRRALLRSTSKEARRLVKSHSRS
jgi:short-subunit dehydrogenase